MRQRAASNKRGDEEEEDDEDQENAAPNCQGHRAAPNEQTAALLRSLQNKSKATMMAASNGGVFPAAEAAAAGGSPRRFLSPQSLRFILLAPADRARVLAAHPSLRAKRDAHRRLDARWTAREKLYDAALTDPSVSLQQRNVLQAVFSGESIFFTGSAGTGKSYLIHKIIACLPGSTAVNGGSGSGGGGGAGGAQQTYATSTTGITAMNIQGCTIFHWAGLGVVAASDSVKALADRVYRNRDTLNRWRSTRTLLIDEISMLDGGMFDRLEEVARVVRDDSRAFGGIQLILCGDFLQLPPVSKKGESMSFCFEASSWARCIPTTIELAQVFRQNDSTFISLLDAVRRGQCSSAHAAMLRACESNDLESLAAADGIRPTSLLTLKKEVDAMNSRELALLPGESRFFQAQDTSASSGAASGSAYLEQLQHNCPARTRLELKVGAQVILLRNLSVATGLANGSRGVVLRFAPASGHPFVKFTTGAEYLLTPETWSVSVGGVTVASRAQLPLDLAWALSIHKSQGLTLDRARIHLGHVFEYGQAYVALSRLRSLHGMQLIGFVASKIKAHPKVLAFYESLNQERTTSQLSDRGKTHGAPNNRAVLTSISHPTLPTIHRTAGSASSPPRLRRVRKLREDDSDDDEKEPLEHGDGAHESARRSRLGRPNKQRRVANSFSLDDEAAEEPAREPAREERKSSTPTSSSNSNTARPSAPGSFSSISYSTSTTITPTASSPTCTITGLVSTPTATKAVTLAVSEPTDSAASNSSSSSATSSFTSSSARDLIPSVLTSSTFSVQTTQRA